MQELRRVRPTAEVIVLHNMGYKRCSKENVSNSHQDLWHANLEVFRRTAHLETPILVLEDDVKFTDHIKQYAADIYFSSVTLPTLSSQNYIGPKRSKLQMW